MDRRCIQALLAAAVALGAVGCEGPVDPARVKLRYGGEVRAPDAVVVLPAWEGELRAAPGERVALPFWVIDGVRDEVFLQVGDTCAYVAGLTLYDGQAAARTGAVGLEAAVPAPGAIDPTVTAATYRRLLPSPRTRGGVRGMPPAETYVPVDLAVTLPKSAFERAEVSVVFSLRGFTRNPAGEIRDTLVKKVIILPKDPAGGGPVRPTAPGKSG